MTRKEFQILERAHRFIVTDGDYEEDGETVKNTWHDGVVLLQKLIRKARRIHGEKGKEKVNAKRRS